MQIFMEHYYKNMNQQLTDTYYFSLNDTNTHYIGWDTGVNLYFIKKIISNKYSVLSWKTEITNWKSVNEFVIYDRYGSKMICTKPEETEFVISDVGNNHSKLMDAYYFCDEMMSLNSRKNNFRHRLFVHEDIEKIKEQIKEINVLFPIRNYMKF